MIKPINISPLNTTQELRYECENCNTPGVIKLENGIWNVDMDGNVEEDISDHECPKCGQKLVKNEG
ncbi:MAG: hypothetical protein UV68_C0041G0012 [Candidatus Collierbacteria bacterium GW2011_GWC2_43_12]|uniref:Uncharacterized protein n=1 Tax=Candidatus Collierbacteria bacterium GW2011_GWC2_43_12 TaxID=1618390 RepID=A0A0G1D426_9BACT|nr:MAG: hypothetical protein UV68_C0041G0012 [Candidatus Collierbacteria bacterium GW2011_GWC2_43_12]